LTRLVARNEVGLYAILPDKSLRMNVNRGQTSFWPASVPTRFHEMDASTVPRSVIDAFQLSNGPRVQDLQWGVTIPSATSRQLQQFLREASGGALIIDARGELRLEP
jgi:ABC-type phosphate transport system auxiliary subunit